MNRIESPEAQLLELLRHADSPSVADRERVRRQVAAKVAVTAVAAAVIAAEPASWYVRLGALTTGWLKGATVATALVTVASGAVYLSTRTKTAPPAVETQTVSPSKSPSKDSLRAVQAGPSVTQAQAPADATSLTEQSAGAAASTSSVATPGLPAGKSTSKGTGSGLEAELALLSKAQRALKAGNPTEALRALDEHQRRFPGGVLSFERAGVRTVALCQSGRLDEGRGAARSYLRQVPNSVLSKRIRVACQLEGE